jgi:hypothetical protein
MATINVSPEGLREAGGELNGVREELVTEGNAHMLHGVGDNQHISTGGFAPGVWAQEMLSRHYDRAQEVFGTVNNNIIALSSAVHIVADLFEGTDQQHALEFAFLNPNVDTPSGLPPYIRPDVNSTQMRQQAELEAALNGGELPEGFRTVTRPLYPNLMHEYGSEMPQVTEIFDDNGNLVGQMIITNYSDGRKVTQTYDGEGTNIGTQEYTPADEYTRQSVTRTYSGDATPENLVRSEHQAVNPDGSTQYYTKVYEDGQPPEYTNEMTVDPEPAGADRGEATTRDLDEMEYAGNVEMERQGRYNPEDFVGPHGEVRP